MSNIDNMIDLRNRSCMSHWFPRLAATGVPVPETRMLTLSREEMDGLRFVLDGPAYSEKFREPVAKLSAFIRASASVFGVPMFLRTGQGSGKHQWRDTCHVRSTDDVPLVRNIYMLIEWSECVDMMGLPYDVWACRKMLPTEPLFHCTRYGGMPVVREWRFFIRDGEIECLHPYWPVNAIEDGQPDKSDWRSLIAHLRADPPERAAEIVRRSAAAFDGYWSMDVLEARDGFYVTDMAAGEASFHDECAGGKAVA